MVASGTAIIDELGPEHVETGFPIVYTSADSVFQIAAHEGIVPVPQLYEWCEAAYDICVKGLGLGRVIARPFIGLPGSFQRTSNRHDYAMPPIGETLLDRLVAKGHQVTSVGKVSDLFAGRGISASNPTKSDADGMDTIEALMATQERGMIFANLVDFDAVYGHRNDTPGYAANLEAFRCAAGGAAAEAADRRSAGDHRRSRQRSDDAEHRPLARARAGPAGRAMASRRASTSGRARRSPTSARRLPKSSASARSPTARASCREIMEGA